ncbi:phosphoribosyl-AMP cyclohydrolase [Rhizobiales bacterium RZME27]|jgi:phosphoribosyl-AMP cyclohydrolase|uniref:Phosphoribosyl-AMP cyclohydrolase n=1 Tax=Endobacterium cereale TaxID=2663029 RepID=A0A6A8A176_9HYPH|nr:phosphoribosyl-AMP cyclohydrolase [Endobacterium cereale]MEB2843510.1 phosphoribosyl-AMP cyclohydrolase [Endobacterium cereale]MQY44625.1 phosphoribosyl-AMP cyclohydrolase [Endobacterium cereale]
MTLTFAAPSADKHALEAGGDFTPRFDAHGLVTAVVTDVRDGELLMVAHMNAEALALTIETGIAHYYSRSRAKIWKKGETSGNLQTVAELRTDCDQDAVWLKVRVGGHDASCHTGRRSCFYRTVKETDGKAIVEIADDDRHFDPDSVYAS